jgi:hypothetical protein
MPWGSTNIALGGQTPIQTALNVFGGQFDNGVWSQAGKAGYGRLVPPPEQVFNMGIGGSAYGPQNVSGSYIPPPTSAGPSSFPVGYSSRMIGALTGTQPVMAPNGVALTGQFGMQGVQAIDQMNAQLAQIGVQREGLAATMAFTTGVGIGNYSGTINPVTGGNFGFPTGPISGNVAGVGSYQSQGGGFWGIQEAQQQLGWMQQQNQFSAQQQQMGIQSSQFYTNMGMQQQQMGMQRGWTQQDWGYQAETRGLNWQWQQQDFQENARFMTGRDRRLAERQMSRAGTMHDLEGDQIEKQKERQKALWNLEDQRFEIQKQQFEENQAFQEEQLEIAIAFFEERKKLEEQSMAMQRAYFIVQQQLSQKALDAQASAAVIQASNTLTMLTWEQALAAGDAQLKTMTEETLQKLRDQIVINVNPALEDFITKLETLVTTMGGTNGEVNPPAEGEDDVVTYKCTIGNCTFTTTNYSAYRQHLQSPHPNAAAGMSAWAYGTQHLTIGEGALPEKVTVEPLGSGSYKSRWNNEVIPLKGSGPVQSQAPIHLQVFIGDDPIVDKVLDAVSQRIKD